MYGTLLLIVALHLCLAALGQDPAPVSKSIRGISFNLNIGTPVGAFASVDKADDGSGYAEAGVGMDLNYLSTGTDDSFAFIATARYFSFGYDIESVAANYISGAPSPGTWYGEGENWKMFSFLVGGNLGSIQNKRFSAGVRAQVGWLFLMGKDRYIYGKATNGTYFYRISYRNEPSSSFTYMLGVNMRWRTSPRSSFTTGIDYMSASPEVGYTSTLESSLVIVGTMKGTFTQPIEAIVISAGFVFIL